MFDQIIKDVVDGLDKKFISRLNIMEAKIDKNSSDLKEIKTILKGLK